MTPVVYAVDDENGVLTALSNLLRSENFNVAPFASAESFLAQSTYPSPCCLIVDINMPEMDGFELSRRLSARGFSIPTIFLTGFGTIPVTVKAMKAGACEFLTKPVEPEKLLQAVSEALKLSEENAAFSEEKLLLTTRYHSLTPRESEVMSFAVSGLLNKQIAAEMGVSEITVKVHKRRVMEKMQLRSLSDLVRAAERINITKSQ